MSFGEHRGGRRSTSVGDRNVQATGVVPGKRVRTARLATSAKTRKLEASPGRGEAGKGPGERAMVGPGYGSPIPTVALAEAGVTGTAQPLPHAEAIQHSFGRHDVSHVRGHVGGAAAEVADALGAEAFAAGNDVAFRGPPDLHTAAHEAAYVVQQRGGVQLEDGVGRIGDQYEQHADAVTDRVVRSESAEALLDPFTAGSSHQAVQLRSKAHLIEADQLPHPSPEDVRLPTVQDPQVGIVDNDTGECRTANRSEVIRSPDFADNDLLRVHPQGDPWTLTVDELQFSRAAGGRVAVSWADIEFEGGRPATSFEHTGGILYPLKADGATRSFDLHNTPNIVRAARLVFDVVAELKNQRVEYAELTMVFAANIASLGGVQQLVHTFTHGAGRVTAPRATRQGLPPTEGKPTTRTPPERESTRNAQPNFEDTAQEARIKAAEQQEKGVRPTHREGAAVPSQQLGPGETYVAHADGQGSQGLMAHLDDDGVLNLYIVAGEGTPRGGAMFNEAMQAFGSGNVRAIRGMWRGGGELSSNFDSFKSALAAGKSPEEAAFDTFTGKMAKRHGFARARIVINATDRVVVEFTR